MRIVLDTNVWISGLILPKSSAGKVITEWKNGHFDVITSVPILQEIIRVTDYKKIQKSLQWDTRKKQNFLSLLKFFTETVVLNEEITLEINLNPKDIPILITLITSKADYLVTGDVDLFNLRQEYPIITLAEFCKMLGIT